MQCNVRSKGFITIAINGQIAVDIANGTDLCAAGNRLVLESSRIPAAVVAFMMVPDNSKRNGAQGTACLQVRKPFFRMLSDRGYFTRSQFPWFRQNLLRDKKHPDVVEYATYPDINHFIMGKGKSLEMKQQGKSGYMKAMDEGGEIYETSPIQAK